MQQLPRQSPVVLAALGGVLFAGGQNLSAIVLTLRARPGVRRQKIAEQVTRPRDQVVEVKDVPVGKGI